LSPQSFLVCGQWNFRGRLSASLVLPSPCRLCCCSWSHAFSVEAKATSLVTTGIYSRIRNPIYVFGGLFIAGVIIWLQKPWFLLCFVILIPLQVIRSRKEARVLEEKFGAAYLEYKELTWF